MLRYLFPVFALGYVAVLVLAFAGMSFAANIVGLITAVYGVIVFPPLLLRHPQRYPDADERMMKRYAVIARIFIGIFALIHLIGLFASPEWQTACAFAPFVSAIVVMILGMGLAGRKL